jgi:hypothetical protein
MLIAFVPFAIVRIYVMSICSELLVELGAMPTSPVDARLPFYSVSFQLALALAHLHGQACRVAETPRYFVLLAAYHHRIDLTIFFFAALLVDHQSSTGAFGQPIF